MREEVPLFYNLAKVKAVQNLLLSCLRTPIQALNKAIEQTVSAQLFPEKEVLFALKHLQNQLENGDLLSWAKQTAKNFPKYSALKKSGSVIASNRIKVVALLAGNLPLVGLQDALALMLFGQEARVKLSKKDPYLIAVLLGEILKSGFAPKLQYSTSLTDFSGFEATHWLFTGDDKNLNVVKSSLEQEAITLLNAPKLARKAGVSVCIINDQHTLEDSSFLEELGLAIYQYQGKGCRSVGVIVLPECLAFVEVVNYLRTVFVKADNAEKAMPDKIRYELAFLRACNFESAYINGMIFTQDATAWQQANKVSVIKEKDWVDGIIPKEAIQSIYHSSGQIKEGNLQGFEDLKSAQTPPLFWKPDAIDTLAWLITAK